MFTSLRIQLRGSDLRNKLLHQPPIHPCRFKISRFFQFAILMTLIRCSGSTKRALLFPQSVFNWSKLHQIELRRLFADVSSLFNIHNSTIHTSLICIIYSITYYCALDLGLWKLKLLVQFRKILKSKIQKQEQNWLQLWSQEQSYGILRIRAYETGRGSG